MILYPNCKINIGLRVVRKREDGYHDLETIFYPIYGLHDTLSVDNAQCTMHGGISFQQEGIAVDCAEEDNLIVRCYRQMAAHYPQIGSVDVRFKKNIPFGAGLGGGSSDAAHMAIALNELFQLGLSQEQLAAEVRSLGADCPFFIYNTPCFAEGIGDILTPIDFSLKGKHLIMIKPDVAVSTKEAYAGLQIAGDRLQGTGSRWQVTGDRWQMAENDFETTVFARHPLLAQIKKHLLDAGAFYAAMSGSGSTIFGLFEDDAERSADSYLGRLDKEFAAMVIFNDTLR